MSEILDKLKKKPVPQKKEEIYIRIDKPVATKADDTQVKITTKIIDKTDEEFNRDFFIQKIKNKGLKAPAISIKGKELVTESTVKKDDDSEKPTVLKVKAVVPKRVKTVKIRSVKGDKKELSKIPEEAAVEKEKVLEEVEAAITTMPTMPSKKSRLSKSILKGTITDISKPGTTSAASSKASKILLERPESMLKMSESIISERIKKSENPQILASQYYMNNREKFIEFINALFMPYKKELEQDAENLSCENRNQEGFSLLTHQKIVRDYINSYTPYRGALLYHGLGSGKTCSSITIAEGIKNEKEIIVLTPASLRMNYIEELKMCGDILYKKNQYWEFINTKSKPELTAVLSDILNIDIKYIERNDGGWLVNTTKESNYETLTTENKESINNQINEMIRSKYKFINYNGLRNSHLNAMSNDGEINPFDNKVVIIDEVHNLISRIVNKIRRPDSMSYRLYNYLMDAKNCRIVLLSGTPIINYPNEIGVIFNILRGYIKTWNIPLNLSTTTKKVDEAYLKEIFSKFPILDYLEYKPTSKILTITRNPLGFINVKSKTSGYKGVKLDERGLEDDEKFLKYVIAILNKNDIEVIGGGIKVQKYKALPDTLEEFKNLFINDDGSINNDNMFKRRIIGLTSYLSDMDALLPRYDKNTDFYEEKIEMSDYQLSIYEKARQAERKLEMESSKKSKKRALGGNIADLYNDTVSTYRIFSRAFCNFVFPEEMKRPMPKDDDNIEDALKKSDENIIDAVKVSDELKDETGEYEEDDMKELIEKMDKATDITYERRIQNALLFLERNADKYLSKEALETYSPKFLRILRNIESSMEKPETDRLHLIYSQFRTLEGIGIMKLVLEYNGFTQFKITKNKDDGTWRINIKYEDKGKPTFILYTGTETAEEKEILRNIFNSSWGSVPETISKDLREISPNNHYGQVIKLIMITSSGAEGISLKNVCYVHLMESYWHPVRLEQVIGRARRICSHQDLPPEMRTVDVYLYLMTLSETQKKSENTIELRVKDVSKLDKNTPLTSDEALHEISELKAKINGSLLKAVKESAFDCVVNLNSKSKEGLKCYSLGSVSNESYMYKPSYNVEERDEATAINRTVVKWKGRKFTLGTNTYVLKDGTDEVYDYDTYIEATKTPGLNPVRIGSLVRKDGKARLVKL